MLKTAWFSAVRLPLAKVEEMRSDDQAVFKNGDTARIHTVCDSGPYDDKGWATMNCDADIAFSDGSHIFMTFLSKHDEKTLTANAAGTFKGGTKRFDGITGSATGFGLTGRMQWTGSYEVPAKK